MVEITPNTKTFIKTWVAAVLLPPIVVFLVQIPLCNVGWISRFFEQLKPSYTFLILTTIFAIPGYIPFFYFLKTRKICLLNVGIFTLLLPPYMVALWILGLNLSRALFEACV